MLPSRAVLSVSVALHRGNEYRESKRDMSHPRVSKHKKEKLVVE